MQQIKKWEEVGLDNSYMFRLVMEDKKLCQPFIECVLDMKISKLVINQAEKSVEYSLNARGIRMDIYAEDDKGTAYDLEMQTVNLKQWDLAKRVRYYQSIMDAKALDKGTDYDKLRKSYVIFVCTFDPFDLDLGRYTFKECCLEIDSNRLILDNGAVHIFINTKGDTKNLSKELQNVIKYINSGETSDEYTKSLHDKVLENRGSVEKERAYMTVEEYARDVGKVMAEEAHKLGLQEGLQLGQEIGLEQGRQQRRNREKEIILNMIKVGMSNADILKLIPDVDEEVVEELRSNL